MQKKIKRIIGGFALAATAAAAIATGLPALEVPPLRQRVNDHAAMLSAQTVNTLESKLEQLERSDSTQIVVLTVPSLEGDNLEDFSMRVAEKWKIGRKKLDNGVILLISKSDRAVRIEVGYGLEGKLTDLVSGRIIDDIIIPNFKNENFDAGVEEAVDAIIAVVRGEFQSKDLPGKNKPSAFSGKYVVFILFLFFILGSVGRVKKIFSGILGAVLLPGVALFLFPIGIWILLLIPVGFILGLIMPFFAGTGGGRHGGGYYRGSGGFSSSGHGGGFSGGGGGFGGGGASGRW